MADTFNPAKRSEIMRAVRSRDTGIEIAVRKLIYGIGFRYRLYAADLPGSPDIVLRRQKKAIFIHGCFWHQHTCMRGSRLPATRTDYWRRKLDRNKLRDKVSVQQLRRMGWKVLTVWECQLRDPERLLKTLQRFLRPVSAERK